MGNNCNNRPYVVTVASPKKEEVEMERMVRLWIDFEAETIRFADRLEVGCQKKRTQGWPQEFFFFNLNIWKNGFAMYVIRADFGVEPKI